MHLTHTHTLGSRYKVCQMALWIVGMAVLTPKLPRAKFPFPPCRTVGRTYEPAAIVSDDIFHLLCRACIRSAGSPRAKVGWDDASSAPTSA